MIASGVRLGPYEIVSFLAAGGMGEVYRGHDSNLSGEKENDYFGDGLSEEILNALTSMPGLKVTARTSAHAFRGRQVDVRTIGETLGVRTILEGASGGPAIRCA